MLGQLRLHLGERNTQHGRERSGLSGGMRDQERVGHHSRAGNRHGNTAPLRSKDLASRRRHGAVGASLLYAGGGVVPARNPCRSTSRTAMATKTSTTAMRRMPTRRLEIPFGTRWRLTGTAAADGRRSNPRGRAPGRGTAAAIREPGTRRRSPRGHRASRRGARRGRPCRLL